MCQIESEVNETEHKIVGRGRNEKQPKDDSVSKGMIREKTRKFQWFDARKIPPQVQQAMNLNPVECSLVNSTREVVPTV